MTGIGLDHPNEPRKKHGTPIPRLGGMPLMLAMSLSLVLILIFRPSGILGERLAVKKA